jgi:hypothetical protein
MLKLSAATAATLTCEGVGVGELERGAADVMRGGEDYGSDVLFATTAAAAAAAAMMAPLTASSVRSPTPCSSPFINESLPPSNRTTASTDSSLLHERSQVALHMSRLLQKLKANCLHILLYRSSKEGTLNVLPKQSEVQQERHVAKRMQMSRPCGGVMQSRTGQSTQ